MKLHGSTIELDEIPSFRAGSREKARNEHRGHQVPMMKTLLGPLLRSHSMSDDVTRLASQASGTALLFLAADGMGGIAAAVMLDLSCWWCCRGVRGPRRVVAHVGRLREGEMSELCSHGGCSSEGGFLRPTDNSLGLNLIQSLLRAALIIPP